MRTDGSAIAAPDESDVLAEEPRVAGGLVDGRWVCVFDGRTRQYTFGFDRQGTHGLWRVNATSLARAVRAFRVGAVFPHQYCKGRIKEAEGHFDGHYERDVYLRSAPGGVVPVRVQDVLVAEIPPEGPEAAEYRSSMLPQLPGLGSETTALQPAGAATGLDSAARRDIETLQLDLGQKLLELERVKRELQERKQALEAEVKRRMEQIWFIELFLGSQEEVKRLAEGQPAPANTPIAVHQRTLCMDEEIAVHDWLYHPDRVGEFDNRDVDAFDRWLVSSPSRLNAILPEQKGIVALRVRREVKEREGTSIADALQASAEEAADRRTYLLVRNGENLYRLWVDTNFWPRFYPRIDEFDVRKRDVWHRREHDEAKMKGFLAGAVVVQGLIERSDLFSPLPIPKLNIFDPEHLDSYFTMVRDDEETLMLTDGDPLANLTWKGYRDWLKSQLVPGTRVLYIGPTYSRFDHDKLYSRTGIKSISDWPTPGMLYTLEPGGSRWNGTNYTFVYRPDDKVYSDDTEDGWRGRPRKRGVRFQVYSDEVVPYDYLSWRVVRHLLLDRGQRQYYGDFFRLFLNWYKRKQAERERERPFVDLVLRQAGFATEADRARVERLVRWWKLKVKEHRDLTEDEPKALRMILQAFLRGDDTDNDPETLLGKAT